jgi:adenylate kinase
MLKNVYYVTGGPASGKGTRCRILAEKLGLPHISTGDILRKRSEIDKVLERDLSAGKLASDSLVLELLLDRLTTNDCKNGYILDGYPRNINQAKEIIKILGKDFNLICIELDIPDNIALERIFGRKNCKSCGDIVNVDVNHVVCDKCGGMLITRSDDTPETILERIKIFKSNQKDIRSIFMNKGYKYSLLNSEKDPEKILDYI